MMRFRALPANVGKTRTLTDINGKKRRFVVLGEITRLQSTNSQKAIYLQRIRFEDNRRTELRLAYYIIGKKPRMLGKWVWGQYATMLPSEDFKVIVERAKSEGWF